MCASISSLLFSEESHLHKRYFQETTVQVGPYIYGDPFLPGYGISIRTRFSGHTFELAPMAFPATRGYFGYRQDRGGVTASYYYSFRKEKVFQPYLGSSYTYVRDLKKRTIYHYDHGYDGSQKPDKISKKIIQEEYISPLMGVQLCGTNKGISGYVFIDILGPILFSNKNDFETFVLPRMGAGLQF